MTGQQGLHISYSCLKLFLGREKPQRLSMGLRGRATQLLWAVSPAGAWIPALRNVALCTPMSAPCAVPRYEITPATEEKGHLE